MLDILVVFEGACHFGSSFNVPYHSVNTRGNETLAIRLNWVGIDFDGTVLDGPQPDIGPWIGRNATELPCTTKVYLLGSVPGERPFHPEGTDENFE